MLLPYYNNNEKQDGETYNGNVSQVPAVIC